jgi:ribonuclease P protein component
LEFPGEQADVPAEQPSASEDARVPPAHAHARRPGDPRSPAVQGPLAAVRLTARLEVLPAAARLRRRAEFTAAVRGGYRASTPLLVVHLQLAGPDESSRTRAAGFVVARPVGGAVDRNRVRRRLRHLVRDRLDRLPAGAHLVVRANPAAAAASSVVLAAQLDRALANVTAKVTGNVGVPA